jgi:hypothetical protein
VWATARRKVWLDTQQQVHMVGPDVSLQNLDVLASTNLPNQIANLDPDVAPEHRLAIPRDEHEVVVAGMAQSLLAGRTMA